MIRILFAGWLGLAATVAAGSPSPDAAGGFLARHWQRPLQHQGAPAAGLPALESSLDPRACGICHAGQFRDWAGSLHARAMGPGLLGQLLDMAPDDREGHQACLRCHAPLAEQADEVVALLSGIAPEENAARDGVHDGPLYDQGLICAACHLRDRRMHGPPRRDGSDGAAGGPHGGFNADAAFEDSRFCAACHQFEADGYALNGKLLENTYEEWRASPQAEAGQSCQSCHMPDRRHLWRGIHDPATVRSGVEIAFGEILTAGGAVSATLRLANTGVGHYFPTYVTPRVVMEAIQLDGDGASIPGTRQEWIVARQVPLDLSEELFDTRLAPGEAAILDYRAPRHPGAASLRLSVQVEPDRFYRDFYRAMLAGGAGEKGAETLRRALREAETSVYVLFQRDIPLERTDGGE